MPIQNNRGSEIERKRHFLDITGTSIFLLLRAILSGTIKGSKNDGCVDSIVCMCDLIRSTNEQGTHAHTSKHIHIMFNIRCVIFLQSGQQKEYAQHAQCCQAQPRKKVPLLARSHHKHKGIVFLCISFTLSYKQFPRSNASALLFNVQGVYCETSFTLR